MNLQEQLLKQFRLTLTNLRIYPPSSPIIEKQVSELYSTLKELLKDNTFVVISEMDGKIFINEQEYQARDPISISNVTNLVNFFVQSAIKSITFKKELTINELKDVLQGLTLRQPKLTTKEIITRIIKEKDIKNISIDEVEYITVLKTDQSVKSILSTLSQPISGLNDLITTLGQVFNELEKIQDEKTKNNLINTIAKHISKLDLSIIRDLFTQQLPPKIESSGLKLQVFNNLTRQHVEEIFNEIITWCKQLRKQTTNEAEYLEELQHLKEFIKLVVNSPVSKLVPIEVFEELFKIGLLDALPEWVTQQKEEKKSWIQQLDEILNTNEPTKLLQEQFLKNLEENIEKLSIIGLEDKIEKIISLMTENLTNPVIKLRQLAAVSINDISNKLCQHQKVKHIKNITANLIRLLIKEQDNTIFEQYITTLKTCLSSLVINQNFDSFSEYAQQLLLTAEEIQKIFPERTKVIKSLFNTVFQQTKESMLSVLKESQDGNIEKILWFLRMVGKEAVDFIINAITESKSNILTENLLLLLFAIKEQQEIINNIKSYLTPQTPSFKLAKIIEVLDRFNYDFSEELQNLYNYTSYANKIAILNYLQKRPNEKNLLWLTSLLDTEEEQILEYLVDILTYLEYKPATEKLIKLLNTKNVDLKKRVCISLGVFKETKAVSKLKKIISSKKTLFTKGEPLDLRITACWALGNYITLPEVKTFFQTLAKNTKDTAIANVAKEILQQK